MYSSSLRHCNLAFVFTTRTPLYAPGGLTWPHKWSGNGKKEMIADPAGVRTQVFQHVVNQYSDSAVPARTQIY
jgi:hypothetical protein